MGNVLTPLRYPGGKSSMYDSVKKIIIDSDNTNCTYVEPYSGGFGVGIKLLFEKIVSKVVINDIDFAIYSFWFSVINHTDELCEMIKNTQITIDEWTIQKNIYNNKENHSTLQIGFATFFLNRCNRSGILKAGPIGGYNQEGNYKIDCRFNKSKLITKIRDIAKYKDNIEVYNLDAIELIENRLINREDNLFINFDPPYVVQGSELYVNHYKDDDHILLADFICESMDNINWIMTYDDNELIKKAYNKFNISTFTLRYSAQTKRDGTELIIYSDNVYNKLAAT